MSSGIFLRVAMGSVSGSGEARGRPGVELADLGGGPAAGLELEDGEGADVGDAVADGGRRCLDAAAAWV